MKKFLLSLILSLSAVLLLSCEIEEVEIIVNGDFDTGSLIPGWTASSPFEGGVVDGGPCFITEYQLTLEGNDYVIQYFDRTAVASSDLTFWYHKPIEDYVGQLNVRVVYTDGTYSSTTFSEYYSACRLGTVVTDKSKALSYVRFRTTKAYGGAWYIAHISMKAYVEAEEE